MPRQHTLLVCCMLSLIARHPKACLLISAQWRWTMLTEYDVWLPAALWVGWVVSTSSWRPLTRPRMSTSGIDMAQHKATRTTGKASADWCVAHYASDVRRNGACCLTSPDLMHHICLAAEYVVCPLHCKLLLGLHACVSPTRNTCCGWSLDMWKLATCSAFVHTPRTF